jgi:hypothetical protein
MGFHTGQLFAWNFIHDTCEAGTFFFLILFLRLLARNWALIYDANIVHFLLDDVYKSRAGRHL